MDKHINSESPIIGLLTQKTDGKKKDYGEEFIPACYVKLLESAGARVVPIILNNTEEYYKDIFNSINGLYLPGGDVDLLKSEAARVSIIFYHLATKANDSGDFFPIWGTCWGFQFLPVITCGTDFLSSTPDSRLSHPLDFQKGYEKSKLFQKMAASEEIIQILSKENVTFNNHNDGFTPEDFKKYGADQFYQTLTLNKDQNGKDYISTIEAYKYPFYGCQWHPEINPFEFSPRFGPHVNHSLNAIKVSQYMANFFVNEARKNHHSFEDKTKESKSLIYNYPPVYTGNFVGYAQCYFFK
ncbi:gamma-glutamyl hydrolase-like [Glandiceps talaboti]